MKWIKILEKVKIFDGIEKFELEKILTCIRPVERKYKKNEYITISEHKIEGIGILVLGEAMISKENYAGEISVIDKIGIGDVFGEVAAFSGTDKWPATIVALSDCVVLFIEANKIISNCPKMCIGHKQLIQNMLKIVSKKAINLNRKIDYLTMKSIRNKISNYLLENYNKKKKLKFEISLNRNELAAFLNISRPSLSRELIKMKEELVIDYKKSIFEIIDLEKLEKNI